MFSVRAFIRGIVTRQKQEVRNEILRAPRVRRFPLIRSFLADIPNHDETIIKCYRTAIICCRTAIIGYLMYILSCDIKKTALRKNKEYKKLQQEGFGKKNT